MSYITHSLSYNPVYHVWYNMHKRCKDPNHTHYKYYGGRGISICPEWDDVATFIKWAETNGYKEGLVLDRRENDGNYTPDNCRFVTIKVNNNNQRSTRHITYAGKTQCLSDWAKEIGIAISVLHWRLNKEWSLEKALSKTHYERTK